MRIFALPLLLLCSAAGFAQQSATSPGIRPQIIVQVKKDPIGADLITVKALDSSYSPKLLRSQSNEIGRLTGSGIRGLRIFQQLLQDNDPSSGMWESSFAVDGLIDSASGVLRLGPIVKAFAGAPKPSTIQAMLVDFDFQRAGTLTLGSYSSPYVSVDRRIVQSSVEYEVTLLTQDPNLLTIPDSTQTSASPVAAAKVKAGTDWVFDVVLLVAALAFGALVYSLLLLRPGKGGKRPLRP